MQNNGATSSHGASAVRRGRASLRTRCSDQAAAQHKRKTRLREFVLACALATPVCAFAFTGNDWLFGGNGRDSIKGEAGADYMSGGRDWDDVDYGGETRGVTVTIGDGRWNDGAAGDYPFCHSDSSRTTRPSTADRTQSARLPKVTRVFNRLGA